MKMRSTNRVLVAPLDWGLGHATRCIPLIAELRSRNLSVWIASSGRALWVLREAFPDLPSAEIASYGIRYGRRLPLMLHLFFQIPRMGWAIWKEAQQVEQLAQQHRIDLIISDNRYGARVRGVRSIFITHQINLRMPRLLKWLQPMVQWGNHFLLRRFDGCWVPDSPDSELSGALSQPALPGTTFVGPLSRMEMPAQSEPFAFDVVVLISGPEPQRSLFEELVLDQLRSMQLRYYVVRGLPGEDEKESSASVTNHLPTDALTRIIHQAEIIVCRSGYSSVMDLVAMGKKALLVPTPGQTEQEYLAERLAGKGLVAWQRQPQLDLNTGIAAAKKSKGFATSTTPSNLLPRAIDALLMTP